MELMFENMNDLKPKEMDIKQMLIKTCYTLKIMFMNKNNSIKVELESQSDTVHIEASNFEYLVVEMARMLHNMMCENLVFKIDF